MPWLFFTALTVFVALGVRKMMRDARELPREEKPPENTAASTPATVPVAQDMVLCTVCGAYVVKNARSCGRAGCPYPEGE